MGHDFIYTRINTMNTATGSKASAKRKDQKKMENEELTMLPVSAIYPHPDNPRKDVGDVTELANSIKKRGILQNLTVMPGHWLTIDEMAAVVEAYTEDPTDELKELIETKWSEEGYTTLIGHRRTAAAKLAGTSEAPCRIVYGLTKNEQISMMLEENMQRNDLTIYEQAESFQLMLDLGETVETLADKTGFSKSTIYHRLNIAKLDQGVLKEKEEDVDERNKILSQASSSENLKYRIEQNVRDKQRVKKGEELVALLKEKGVQQSEIDIRGYTAGYEGVDSISLWNTEDAVLPELPEDTSDIVFYHFPGNSITIKRKIEAPEADDSSNSSNKKSSELASKIRENTSRLNSIEKSFDEHFGEFVDMTVHGKIPVKDDLQVINSLIVIGMQMGFSSFSFRSLCNCIDEHYQDYDGEDKKKVERMAQNLPVTVYILCALHNNLTYGRSIYNSWNNELNTEYALLVYKLVMETKHMGFVPDDDEFKLIKGTHPLFDEIKELEEQRKAL